MRHAYWHTGSTLTSKGPFIATQLNSTQLNSTDPVEQRTAKSVVFLFMTSRPTNWVNWVTTFIDRRQYCCSRCERVDNSTSSWGELSCVGVAIDTSPTQLNSTRRRVELCRYKRAFKCVDLSKFLLAYLITFLKLIFIFLNFLNVLHVCEYVCFGDYCKSFQL